MVERSKVPTTTLAIKEVGKRRNICPLPLLYMRVKGRSEADSALYGCIMGDVGSMCVPSPMYVMPERVGGGGASLCVMRCGGAAQRGAGIDHLAQVQQKNVQTEIFRTPGAITTRKGTHSSYNAEVSYESMLCTYGLCSHESCVFSVANRDLDLHLSNGE